MKNDIKVVIKDMNDCDEVIGIITLRKNTYSDLEKTLAAYKQVHNDSWTWKGFIEYLSDELKWDFGYEQADCSGNIWELSI